MGEKRSAKNRGREGFFTALIIALCLIMAVLEAVEIRYTADKVKNKLIGDTLPLVLGAVAVVVLMIRGGSGLFQKPQKLLFLLPCMLVAVNNFPYASHFSGKSELTHATAGNLALFAAYCLMVGVFEECVFRGVLFPLLAGCFNADRKGVILTFFLSSVIFGASHILNLFVGAGLVPTLLQVGYSTLIGGLCAFALMKTKNILSCILVHATYDFAGLMLPTLGGGAVFDLATGFCMGIVGVLVAAFVLWSVFRYTEDEREALYARLGFGVLRETGKTATAE